MNNGFGFEEYSTLRPHLYHTLLQSNLAAVKASRRLLSATALRALAGDTATEGQRRDSRLSLKVPFGEVAVHDQAPLFAANIDFQGGWTFRRLIEEIDQRVFFWPGDERGPISYGQRHFERYQTEAVVLRVPFRAMWEAADPKPEFCKFNSGSPRCVGGRRSPRGPDTFMPYVRTDFPAREVVEVTFRESITLPDSTEWSRSPQGPWTRLW